MLPDTPADRGVLVATRIRSAISATPIEVGPGLLIAVSASVGCAAAIGAGLDQLIGRADAAMYAAKRSRRMLAIGEMPLVGPAR